MDRLGVFRFVSRMNQPDVLDWIGLFCSAMDTLATPGLPTTLCVTTMVTPYFLRLALAPCLTCCHNPEDADSPP